MLAYSPGPRRIFALLALIATAACVPASQPVSGDRATARDVALRIVAERDPVIEAGPVADCVAQNATREEASMLAAAGQSGDRSGAIAALDVILRKVTTQTCLQEVGSPDFFV